MKLLLVVSLAVLALVAAPPAASSIVHCSEEVLAIGAGDAVVGYFTWDEGGGIGTAPPRPVLYLETNDAPGLQRGTTIGVFASPCEDSAHPDLRVGA